MSTTQAQERTAIVKASSERVRAWLVSGCAGKPPLIDIAAMRELVEMMLATPPSPAAPQGVVAWEYEANYIPHPDRDDGIHVTRWKVEAEVNGLTGSIKPLVYAQSAGEQTGPVPARPAPVEVEALKFDIRQAMIEYGLAFKRNDEEGIRETSTRCCALLDQLAALASPAQQTAENEDAALLDEAVWYDVVCTAEHLCPWDLAHLDKQRWKARHIRDAIRAALKGKA
jgi:hypothetical protein